MNKSMIDRLLDPEDYEPIVMFNEKGEDKSFEKIAIIPLDNEIYVILLPIFDFDGYDGCAFVFRVDAAGGRIEVVENFDIINRVFDIYEALAAEGQ